MGKPSVNAGFSIATFEYGRYCIFGNKCIGWWQKQQALWMFWFWHNVEFARSSQGFFKINHSACPNTPFKGLVIFGITCSSILSCPGGHRPQEPNSAATCKHKQKLVPRTGYFTTKNASHLWVEHPIPSCHNFKKDQTSQVSKETFWSSMLMCGIVLVCSKFRFYFTASDSICIRMRAYDLHIVPR
jgi:hypothetical protein